MGSSVCPSICLPVHQHVRPSHLSFRRHNEMGSLWTQLLLQFLTNLFETLLIFLWWSEDVHLVLGLSSHIFFFFLSTSSNFRLIFFFSGQITIRIDAFWTQLLLRFSTDHFETTHTCSTWFVDVHVVLGLSYHYFFNNFFYFLDFFQVRLLLE